MSPSSDRFIQHVDYKAARSRLTRALHENQLITPFLLMISQCRTRILYDSEERHLKVMSRYYDRAHGTLLLLIEFLHMNVPTHKLVEILPSLRTVLLGMNRFPFVFSARNSLCLRCRRI